MKEVREGTTEQLWHLLEVDSNTSYNCTHSWNRLKVFKKKHGSQRGGNCGKVGGGSRENLGGWDSHIHNTICETDHQEAPTAKQRECYLKQSLISSSGKEQWLRADIISESVFLHWKNRITGIQVYLNIKAKSNLKKKKKRTVKSPPRMLPLVLGD